MSRAERVEVDRIACTGHGACADLVPELIHRDVWGYPVVADEAVPHALRGEVRRAVRTCPALALRLRSASD